MGLKGLEGCLFYISFVAKFGQWGRELEGEV